MGHHPVGAGALAWRAQETSPGTTGFDAVGSWGWLRAEVPEASLNPGKTIRADSHEYALAV